MRKSIRRICLLAVLAASGPVAADSMRCGSRLMTDGDPASKVLAYCGEPAAIERREILRPWGYHHGVTVHSTYEVSVELWTYNFGPHKLMYRLRFEDGLLVDVDTLGHGYHPTNTGY
jgi:hypothetical protein